MPQNKKLSSPRRVQVTEGRRVHAESTHCLFYPELYIYMLHAVTHTRFDLIEILNNLEDDINGRCGYSPEPLALTSGR